MSLPSITPIKIVAEDYHFLVIDKPHNRLSVPGNAARFGLSVLEELKNQYPTVLTVHRLDYATSGLMVVALSKKAHRELSQQFAQRKVIKTYWAWVLGKPLSSQGIIDVPIGADWLNKPRQKIDFNVGKASQTYFKLLRVCTTQCPTSPYISKLALSPLTGRTHQLRVHMQWLGHEILGCPWYAKALASIQVERLMLQAQNLQFQHPISGDSIQFSSQLRFGC